MPTLETPAVPPPATRKKSNRQVVEYHQYIEDQIEQTRRTVKMVDLAQALLLLVAGLLAFLLTATMLEHWILPGGLSSWGRTSLFFVLVSGVGYFLVRKVWPLLTRPINPSYAAQAIEREHPTLKNSLINFLLFRSRRPGMPPAVFDALEEQAAKRLLQTTTEGAVDRGPLIRLGYLLLAMTVVAVIYSIVSPKSPLSTAARVLLPWADFAPPSRVRIAKIEPGNIEIVQGDSVEIAANIHGVRPGEEVLLSYESMEGQRMGESVPMVAANDTGKFTCHLPPKGDAWSSSGIRQNLRYRILAGDGRSIDYTITVLTAPAIRVRRVGYDFPEYTGYEDLDILDRGDIRAIEGTKITIHAEANSEIESAHLDLASDGRLDQRMRAEGVKAQVGFDLRIEGDRRAIRNTSYQLRFTNSLGLANKKPPQHSIEVLPDYAPEIELTEPVERVREIQIDETVSLKVDARDPDFALAEVWIRMEKSDGNRVVDQSLLSKRHAGRYSRQWNFTPSEQGLQAGDVVEYWAEAIDVRAPQANRAESIHKEFRIVGVSKNGEPASAAGKNGEKGDSESANGDDENGDSTEEGGVEGDSAEGGNAEDGDADDSAEGGNAENGDADGSAENDSAENGGAGVGGAEGGEPNEGNPGGDAGESGESGELGQGNQGGSEAGGGKESANATGEQSGNGSAENGQMDDGGDPLQQSQEPSSQESGEPNGESRSEGNAGNGKNTQPVANDGSDDTTAFDKIQRQLNQQEQEKATRRKTEPQPGDGDSLQRSKENGNPENTDQGGTPSPKEADGTGEETKSDTPPSDGSDPTGEKPNGESQSTGGEEKTGKGDPGEGEEASPEGSPDAQREQQQRGKRPDTGEPDSETDSTEPPAPGHSKHESDSRGEQGGDRSGGGEEGGGQKAPREGTGSAGQNQAADKGAGQSADQGPGEAGSKAGNAEPTNQSTGNSSKSPGEAASAAGDSAEEGTAKNTEGEPQDNADGQPNQGQGEPSSQGSEESKQGKQPDKNDRSEGKPSSPGGPPSGAGGTEGQDQPLPNRREGSLAEADEANLEYTRKQTKLILDQLEEQLDKNQVDQEMLDQLGWTKDDLRKFVDRWNQLRADAARPGADAAQQELDARLKNLGSTVHPTAGRTLRKQDDFRDLREGYHNKVPLKYRDRLRAYTEGVSKSRE